MATKKKGSDMTPEEQEALNQETNKIITGEGMGEFTQVGSNLKRVLGKEVAGPPKVGRLDKEGKTGTKVLTIPKPKHAQFTVAVQGDPSSSLVMHEWSKKALQQMLGDHMGFKIEQGEKDPFAEFVGSLSFDRRPPNELVIKSVPFKAAMIAACRLVPNVKQVDVIQCLHVLGDYSPLWGFPTNRLDPVKIGPWNNRVADLRFRGELQSWMTVLTIRHDPDVVSMEAIMHLLARAGTDIGVGEWRPDKGGNRGMFEIVAGGPEEAERLKAQLGRTKRSDLTVENSGTREILEEVGLLHLQEARDAERKNGTQQVHVGEQVGEAQA